MEAKQKCPLCQEKYAPMQLRSHLGRHLEQIAPFILPEASENEDSGSDHDSDDGNISTAPDMESKTPSLGRRFQGGLLTAQNFLKTGSGINAFDGKGYTPIHKAAQAGDVKRVTLLLESGCDPLATTKDSHKMQPLHLAARNGHAEVVSVLLKQKTVNINTKNGESGNTALMWACQYNCQDVIKLLLAWEDVEVNAKDNGGKTALMWAFHYNCQDVVKLLLAREDVEVNAKDNGGETALMWACQYNYQDVVKLLLAREDVEVNAKDNGGKTALMFASHSDYHCYSFHERIVRLLLDRKDIDVDAEDKDGDTALVVDFFNFVWPIVLAQRWLAVRGGSRGGGRVADGSGRGSEEEDRRVVRVCEVRLLNAGAASKAAMSRRIQEASALIFLIVSRPPTPAPSSP
ncbi:ankyrin repeat-containing domain protein [Pyronema domesticum]|nr:ankyrin repeat-containing domain protein [Pyronema domesticum]